MHMPEPCLYIEVEQSWVTNELDRASASHRITTIAVDVDLLKVQDPGNRERFGIITSADFLWLTKPSQKFECRSFLIAAILITPSTSNPPSHRYGERVPSI